jgi:hypothetical protein
MGYLDVSRKAAMLKALVPTIVLAQLLGAADATILAAGDAPGGGGGITGTVSVAGNYQRPKPLPVFKNRTFCGAAVPNETLLIDAEGGLSNAVVTLRPLDHKVSTQPSRAVLDNQRCAFAPHVQLATVGSELLLKNSDPILHAVHARLGKETLFNVGLPRWRQVSKRLDRVGVIRIDCDVLHTWMSAAIVVVDTPYFAVSDGGGRFAIEHVPAGDYAMEVWHERLGLRRQSLRLSAAGQARVDIVFSMENSR